MDRVGSSASLTEEDYHVMDREADEARKRGTLSTNQRIGSMTGLTL